MNNPNKNSSAWILCPSKSIAGKFYYFNVTTGEAVWSSNVAQTKLKNESNVQNVMNKSHPDIVLQSPSPASPSTSNCFKIPYANQNMCTMPNFGQLIFPNYLTNATAPFICTPVPMIMNFDTKRMMNQEIFRNDNEILVKTSNISLSNRFTLIKSNEDFESPKKTTLSPISMKTRDLTEPVIKKFKLPESSVNGIKRVDTSTQYDLKVSGKKLDEGDLRYILLKRKADENLEVKQAQKKPTKKGVSFCFDSNDGNSSIDKEDDIISIKLLKNLSKFPPDKEWYVIVDQDVLLHDFDFIMKFISTDELCKLLIPNTMSKHIKLLAVGEHGGRQNVIVARQVYRRLTSCSEKVLIFEMGETTKTDQLINCITATNENNHVVLITNNNELYKTAKNSGIYVYKLDDVKTDQVKINKAKEITIVPNKQNIFLQKKADIDPFVLSKSINISDNFKHIKDAIPNINSSVIIDKNIDFQDIMKMKRVVNNTCNIKMAGETFLNSKIPKTNQLFTHDTEETQKVLLNNKEVDNFRIKKVISKEKSELHNTNIGININNKENFGKISIPLETKGTMINEVKTTKLAETDNKTNQLIDKLKKFNFRDKSIDIPFRIDECVCWYRQIMEEFINILLQYNMSAIDQLPCFLREGLECLLSLYVDSHARKIINNLLALWNNSEKGNNKISPNDLMEMIKCGLSLVEYFKIEKTGADQMRALKNNIIPEDAKEINDLLRMLVDNIDNPIIEDLDNIQTPVGTNEDDKQMLRCNFIKNRSDIIEYLKKHFAEWKNIKEMDQNTSNKELSQNITILRTSGKNLNTVKIDNQNRITFDTSTNKNGMATQADTEKDILDMPVLHENTFDDNNDEVGPKVIRNVKLIDEFENKLKIDKLPNESNDDGPKYEYNKFLDIFNEDNDDETNNDDSGFENDSVHTCSFLRLFLEELSSTFMSIYNFTQKCYMELQSEDTKEEVRECLYDKVRETHSQMSHIIDHLKSIIQRETENTKINSIVRTAGANMAQDLRLMRYKQTVTKCVEQALILDNCLKLILSSYNNDDMTITSKELSQNITILRTSGKNLNTVKIDNQNRITFDTSTNKNGMATQADTEKDILDMPVLHENTFDDNNDEVGPKVIRNVKLIDEFENKLKIDKLPNESNDDGPKYEYNKFLDIFNEDNDDETNNDDSGFENDSVHTCSFLRLFLEELSSTFMSIYNFTQKCYMELQSEDTKEEVRECLYDKVRETHSQMSHIIDHLKSIIQRETENTKINSIVRTAGANMAQDLRLMRYKQTVTKCVEQALILDNCLKLILSSYNNDDMTITSKELSQNITILRTSGKNLNTVKIDNQNRITFDTSTNKNGMATQADTEKDILDMPVLHENTFDDNNDEVGPKVIRNVKLIDEFENKLKIDKLPNESNDDGPKYEYNKFLDIFNEDNDDETNNDDSGFENDSVHTCSFLRLFLEELSSTFMSIYNFTQKCYMELQSEDTKEEVRECLYDKVRETHSQMSHIIDHLKSIIQRETENTKINSIVRTAGANMAQDLRLMRYKQTVTKCVEQALILDNCLKLILSSYNNDDMTITSVGVTYYNMFEL